MVVTINCRFVVIRESARIVECQFVQIFNSVHAIFYFITNKSAFDHQFTCSYTTYMLLFIIVITVFHHRPTAGRIQCSIVHCNVSDVLHLCIQNTVRQWRFLKIFSRTSNLEFHMTCCRAQYISCLSKFGRRKRSIQQYTFIKLQYQAKTERYVAYNG